MVGVHVVRAGMMEEVWLGAVVVRRSRRDGEDIRIASRGQLVNDAPGGHTVCGVQRGGGERRGGV